MRRSNWLAVAIVALGLGLVQAPGIAAEINVSNWAQAIAATPVSGDVVNFAAGTYTVTAPINVVSGVTYKGAGQGVTILDGGGVSRAFNAWGDQGATDGVVDAVNDTGQKGWVIQDLTITNGMSDAANRQNILGVARNLLDNIATAAGADNIYDATEAAAQQGALNDNPTWFGVLAGDASLTQAELEAYLAANPPGSAGHLTNNDQMDDDGGALKLDNGANGTVRNVAFLANTTVHQGGAIGINGQLSVITIEDCLFDGNKVTDPTVDDGACIRQQGGSTTNQQGSSVFVYNSIFRNHLADQGAVMMSGAAYSTTVMKNCLIENNNGNGNGAIFLINSDWNKDIQILNCVIKDNTMDTAGADMFHLRGGFGTTVANCTFVNNVMDGNRQTIVANRQSTNPPVDINGDGTLTAADFTIVNSINNIFLGNVVQNNLHRGNRAGGTPSNPASLPNTTIGFMRLQNNITFNNFQLNGTTAAGYNAADNQHVGEVAPPAPINADPLLNATTFVPNTGSPAINAADPTYAPADDFRGWDRVGVADIGALEFGAVAPPPTEGEGEGEGEPGPTGNEITSNVYPPFIDEGTTVILTAPTGTDFQWRKGAADIVGATNQTLVFDPVTEEDAGVYRVEYNDGLKAIVLSDPFNLIVQPEGSVPAAGLIGIIALAGACGLGGARLIRRRK